MDEPEAQPTLTAEAQPILETAAQPTETAEAELTRADSGPTGGSLDDIEVGTSIDDFDLLVALGRGAFARVFLARQKSMQRLVAVKVSRDHSTEPQTLARLDHDYIVRVFDQRIVPDRQLRLLYMQYLPGGTLLRVLDRVRNTPAGERSGRLLLDVVDETMSSKGELHPTDSSVREELARSSWPETVAWLGRRLADALDHAARHGVLHRDIKPANILLTAEGVPKLADFNISFSETVTGSSPLSYFGGSLAYMSPEQLAACHRDLPGTAADLDTRSDIFALGVMLWELLTGRRPFEDGAASADSLVALQGMLDRRRAGVPDGFVDLLPDDCPAALRRVLLTCLAPRPRDRWSSGRELAHQFDLCLDPRARDLVDPQPGSRRLRLRKWAVVLLVLGIAVPNALAAAYNYHHNKMLIIGALSPEVGRSFEAIQTVINGIAFPLGTVVLVYLCRYPLLVPHGLRSGKTYDKAALARARTDTLLLGDRVVMVVFGLWVIAGIAYPITLQITAGDVPRSAYVHFLASLVVCGAISVAYPFFIVAFLSVRYIYPVLLPQEIAGSDDARKLHGLARRSTRYLALAASVPLAGVAGVTFLSPTEITMVIVAVRILCVGGILAFVGVYWLFRELEQDLTALEHVVEHDVLNGNGRQPP
ncbi:serine/threonine-protein kinase [Rhodococcus sp. NPDC058521]|uniref:serine/threonine-protein kinase n=1 Tax=Rhodococcus sp. NPDC058521 TaxID=3346536 RepID=UPI0036579024